MMLESEAEQLARAVRALEPLAEEACSSLQRQLKIAPLALLASLVLSPDSTPPFTKEEHNAFARLQVGINSVGDGQRRLYKLTPALVPTVQMSSLAVAAGAAAGVGFAPVAHGGAKTVSAVECWLDLHDEAAGACVRAGAPSPETQRRRAEEDLLEMLERDRQAAACADARKASAVASVERRRQQASRQPRGAPRGHAAASACANHTVDESLEELVLAPSTPIDASELQCGGWVSVGPGRTRRSGSNHANRAQGASPASGGIDGVVGDMGAAVASAREHQRAMAIATGEPRDAAMASEGASSERLASVAAVAAHAKAVLVAGGSAAPAPEAEVERLRAVIVEERERHAREVATLRLEYDAALEKAGQRIQALRLRLFILEAAEDGEQDSALGGVPGESGARSHSEESENTRQHCGTLHTDVQLSAHRASALVAVRSQ